MIRIDPGRLVEMPEWWCNFWGSDSANLVSGALLAGIVGIITTKWQDRTRRKAMRRGLASLLHAELSGRPPRDNPVYEHSGPPTVQLLTLGQGRIMVAAPKFSLAEKVSSGH